MISHHHRYSGHSHNRTAILAFVAILLALFAVFRVFVLLNNENPPAGNNTLPTRPAMAVLPFADVTTDASLPHSQQD